MWQFHISNPLHIGSLFVLYDPASHVNCSPCAQEHTCLDPTYDNNMMSCLDLVLNKVLYLGCGHRKPNCWASAAQMALRSHDLLWHIVSQLMMACILQI